MPFFLHLPLSFIHVPPLPYVLHSHLSIYAPTHCLCTHDSFHSHIPSFPTRSLLTFFLPLSPKSSISPLRSQNCPPSHPLSLRCPTAAYISLAAVIVYCAIDKELSPLQSIAHSEGSAVRETDSPSVPIHHRDQPLTPEI